LKGGAPAPSPLAGIQSGLVNRTFPSRGSVPPLGMRSAVPLGGLGAGAIELRADGTFHEATIINQSPAGAAKFGRVEDMVLGVYAGGVAKVLRTHAPAWAAGAGVQQVTYSGSYPLSRLAVSDPELGEASLYAYSVLKPGDAAASAHPAVSFTLAATNPGAAPINVSLMLMLPFAAVNDCARASAAPSAGNASVATPAACLQACAAAPTCASWTFDSATGSCRLASDVPPSVHAAGSFCGVAGGFSTSAGLSLSLVTRPAGGAGAPASGEMALRPVLVAGAAPSFAAGDDAAQLLADFAAHGAFTGPQALAGAPAALGAAAVSYELAAGESVALTIVWSWYFPDRDHMGVNVGNFYSTLWEGADAVAAELATEARQLAVVGDLNAHHAVYAGAGSSLPDWLADMAINQMSHFRGMIYTRDGRMREFEANDCPDVDSIHNDYQRRKYPHHQTPASPARP